MKELNKVKKAMNVKKGSRVMYLTNDKGDITHLSNGYLLMKLYPKNITLYNKPLVEAFFSDVPFNELQENMVSSILYCDYESCKDNCYMTSLKLELDKQNFYIIKVDDVEKDNYVMIQVKAYDYLIDVYGDNCDILVYKDRLVFWDFISKEVAAVHMLRRFTDDQKEVIKKTLIDIK